MDYFVSFTTAYREESLAALEAEGIRRIGATGPAGPDLKMNPERHYVVVSSDDGEQALTRVGAVLERVGGSGGLRLEGQED